MKLSLYKKTILLLKTYSLFLFLVPFFFIYNAYNELFGFLKLKDTLYTLIYILSGVIILYFVFYFSFRSFQKSAIFTISIAIGVLIFGFIHDSLKSILPGSFITRYKYLIPLLIIVYILFYWYLKKEKKALTGIILYLNLLFLFLNLSEIPASLYKYRINKETNNLIDYRFSVYNDYNPRNKTPDSLKPDIYFLVFDEMASSKTLRNVWNIDNSRLDSFLNNKGFYTAANAESNYSWTVHSISSTLNMDYLPKVLIPELNNTKSYFWSTNSIKNNSLTAILRKEGYEIFQFQSISFDNKDWPYEPNFQQYRKYHYFYKTLPGRLYRDLFWNINKTKIRDLLGGQLSIIKERNKKKDQYLKYVIRKVKESTSYKSKTKFVYGHFMVPHDPYIYDSIGNILPDIKTIIQGNADLLDKYKNQLYYADRILEEVINHIHSTNKKNTVIIVEGDHGFRFYTHEGQNHMYKNMNAIYFPDKNYKSLYDSLCPVNTFRIVLNKYFGTEYELLENKSIFIPKQRVN